MKGIRTAFLNISSNNGHTFDCDDEDEDGECTPWVSNQKGKKGGIFIHAKSYPFSKNR
jgi:hypothetical protein